VHGFFLLFDNCKNEQYHIRICHACTWIWGVRGRIYCGSWEVGDLPPEAPQPRAQSMPNGSDMFSCDSREPISCGC
jgi:hypothetical protein